MRRGTRVGQAYVAVTADASGINEEIAEGFDKFDSKGMAEKHGQIYRNNFLGQLKGLDKSLEKELDRSFRKLSTKAGRELNSRMARAFDSEDELGNRIRGNVLEGFKRGDFKDLLARAGREAGDSFGAEFDAAVKNAVLNSVEDSFRRQELGGGNVHFLDEKSRSGVDLPGRDARAAIEAARAAGEEYRRIHQEREAAQAKADRDRRQTEIDHAELLAKIEQRRRSALDEYNRREIADKINAARLIAAAEKERADIAQARRDDDTKFLRFEEEAINRINRLRLSPSLDQAKIREVQRRLRDSLESEEGLRLQLKGDLSERERAKIKAQLESIEAKIRLDTDRDHLTKTLRDAMRKAEGDVDRGSGRLGDRFGRGFGRGSRSTILHALGGMIRLALNAMQGLLKSAQRVGGAIGSAFTKGFQAVGDQASLGTKIFGGLSSTMGEAGAGLARMGTNIPQLVASLALLSAGITVVISLLSVLASVLSALTAIITALVATITSGLVGALAVLGGGLLAVAAAGGLLVNVFTSLTTAQKALMKDAFSPLRDMLTGLGQIMAGDLIRSTQGFTTWANNLSNAIVMLVPLARVMGRAFGEAGNILTAAFTGPGFQRFTQALAVYLPNIIKNLSTFLGGFLNGLLGMFAAITPKVDSFSGTLARLGERFSEWANSAEGQNSIVDFVDRALVSLKSLWNFTTEFFGWLFDVMFNPTSQDVGNTLFDKFAEGFERLRQKIADGSLERWFAGVTVFAERLGVFLNGLFDVFQSLSDKGVLDKFGQLLEWIGEIMSDLAPAIGGVASMLSGSLVSAATLALGPLKLLGDTLSWVKSLGGGGGSPDLTSVVDQQRGLSTQSMQALLGADNGYSPPGTKTSNSSNYIKNLMSTQAVKDALAASGASAGAAGAYKTPKAPKVPKYHNPYTKWANSLIKDTRNSATSVRNAVRLMAREIFKAVDEAEKILGGEEAGGLLRDLGVSIRESGKNMVDSAQSALNSAASSLANATSAKTAAAALKKTKRAQRNLKAAQKAQKRLNKAALTIAAQGLVDGRVILDSQKKLDSLVAGGGKSSDVSGLLTFLRKNNATLATYAEVRARVAEEIEKANTKLAEAIAMRDDYKTAIKDSITSFGSLVSATAQSIDGVQQALTATDVTKNLQDRLDKARKFQETLRQLSAMGLSDAAYKQLLDAGVDGGSETANALLAGGIGSVQSVNDLIAEFDKVGEELGSTASSRLYQAGVDAAQGLVNGLLSLSSQLDSAAAKLGESIAAAVKRSLGIKSPSRVMAGMMGYVGDGAVVGLDAQHSKVSAAADRFSNAIAVSPEVALHAARNGQSPTVSGNGNDIDITIITPTEDPHAVAMETMNELTGRII